MKTYNALSKSFTDKVKTKMIAGSTIDVAFNKVKSELPPSDNITTGDGEHNGFYYVDLKLPSKTLWATCNVGATKPEDEGLLFQFGRVDGYAYNDSNNQFRTNAQNKQDTGNDYIPKTTSGKTYNVGETLQTSDDAAHVNMGGTWRMPTNSELEELINNTTHEVKTINNTPGTLFISKKNGHKLFIPFAGGWFGSFTGAEHNAYIWSSFVDTDVNSRAYSLDCDSSNGAYVNYFYSRSDALSVRGVFKK